VNEEIYKQGVLSFTAAVSYRLPAFSFPVRSIVIYRFSARKLKADG
jgi:hypothetical protein